MSSEASQPMLNYPLRSAEEVIGEIEQLRYEGIETPYQAMQFLSLGMERARNKFIRGGSLQNRHVADLRVGLESGMSVEDIDFETAQTSVPRRTLLLCLFAPLFIDVFNGEAPKDVVQSQQYRYERAFNVLDGINSRLDEPDVRIEGLQTELLVLATHTYVTKRYLQLAIPTTIDEDTAHAQSEIDEITEVDTSRNSWDMTVVGFNYRREQNPRATHFQVQPDVLKIDSKRSRIGTKERTSKRADGINLLTAGSILSTAANYATAGDFMGVSDRAISLRYTARERLRARLILSQLSV